MTSNSADSAADLGILSPAWAGTPVAAATSDASIVRAILAVEAAFTRAQAGLGIAPQDAAELIARAAAEIEIDIHDVAVRAREGGNPVIPILADLRAAVGAADPDAAGWVHLGATSQDILDTALVLVARRSIELLTADLGTACDGLVELARAHRHTTMAARTLGQHSVPTTFGLKAAGWLTALADAGAALSGAAADLPVQLGGASGTLASFAEVADRSGASASALDLVSELAAALGLAVPVLPWHTRRAPVTRLADALTEVSDALGTIAADTVLMSRTEIAELREPAGSGRGGSSAMPQKRNPVLSVLIQSATRQAPEIAAELHRSATAIDERPDGAWHAEWQPLRELLRLVGGAASLAAELLPGLEVDTERMHANLELTGPLIVSERVMIVLGPILRRGRVQELVSAVAADHSLDVGALLRQENELADWSEHDLAALVRPENYLGQAEDLIDRALQHAADVRQGVGR